MAEPKIEADLDGEDDEDIKLIDFDASKKKKKKAKKAKKAKTEAGADEGGATNA
jgi:hypothetical protein